MKALNLAQTASHRAVNAARRARRFFPKPEQNRR
jgi:hypothetical protein